MSLTDGGARPNLLWKRFGRAAATRTVAGMERSAADVRKAARAPGGRLDALAVAMVIALVNGCLYPATVPPARIGGVRAMPVPAEGAAPSRPVRGSAAFDPAWEPESPPRQWKYIVIHHTAANAGSVESIDRAHRQRKDSAGNNWLGIGYHFVIGNGNGMGDGAIEPTFRWKKQMQGAHAGVKEYNERGIGVALIGNFEERDPTPAQLEALRRLLAALTRRYGIAPENVIGHSDIKSTACPGSRFPLEQIRRELEAAGTDR